MARDRGLEEGPLLHVVSSISASFGSSFLSAPADMIMARYMAADGQVTLIQTMRQIHAEGGVLAFWKGWGVFFFRLAPVLLTYSTVYEGLRKSFGLGYMT